MNARTLSRIWNPRPDEGVFTIDPPIAFGQPMASRTIAGFTLDTAPLVR